MITVFLNNHIDGLQKDAFSFPLICVPEIYHAKRSELFSKATRPMFLYGPYRTFEISDKLKGLFTCHENVRTKRNATPLGEYLFADLVVCSH